MKNLLSCLILIMGYSQIFAQATGQSRQIIVPIQMSDKLGKEALTNVDFMIYPYVSNKIDMRDFKSKHEELSGIDDWIIINPPRVDRYEEVNVMIGRVEGVPANESAVVIWLVANYSASYVTFFFDDNLNRDFTDENHQMVLKPNNPYQVQLNPQSGAYNERTVEITLPERRNTLQERNKKVIRKMRQNNKLLIHNQWSVGIQASVGSGKNEFRFQNEDLGYPTWYSVDYTQKGIGLNIGYSLPFMRLGVNGMFQNHFFYTSYLNKQFGEPAYKVIQGRRTLVDQVQTERNQDLHSTNHLQYTAELALRLIMSPRTEIQPFVTYGRYAYSDGVYIADRHEAETQTYDLPASQTIEMGVRFEFAIGNGKTLHIDAMMQNFDWNPEAYFNTFNYSNLSKTNRVFKILVGYRFGI